MEKSIDEINRKIRDGSAVVVTAEDMPDIVSELGEEGALLEVDVVTTGTFGAMCSSGAFLNFGHADPPIRMERVWLNDVEAYAGIAAVDAYIGATQESTTEGINYGGAHVIEDLVSGKQIELRAISKGTDCYPRRTITTDLLLEDLNQAVMVNPRNAYQCYNAATNRSDRTLNTYMGTLLSNNGNISYSGAGLLSPIANDPHLSLIGSGVPIFLGGGRGVIVGEGTQSSPASGFSTLMVSGDLKSMNPEYLRAASITGYGVSLYVGLGIPLPVVNLDVVRNTSVRDEDLITSIVDYGVPRRDRPVVQTVTYAELKSGSVEINGEMIRTSSMSSYSRAKDVALEVKRLVEEGSYTLALPTLRITTEKRSHPMRETKQTPRVREIMNPAVVTITEDESVKTAARKLLKGETNHLPVIDANKKLVGIITTYDVSKSVLLDGDSLKVSEIMSRKVIVITPDEAVDVAAMRLEQHNISALPVVNSEYHVIGILNAVDLGKLFSKRWQS
ncbi:homocysteine biosynthesis protein [Methanocalculus sp.]|uniref:homocysteine biosynthesis protein n=1 Tax=Methanocalculus sp. TaxID=2004547 RepID=UPI00272398BF|nr:homocysteine biosynthesis protein [Methanocalculus sp.]MDO8842662.1 homocysteine biosynthesis protein [Methanocalculus sp.]